MTPPTRRETWAIIALAAFLGVAASAVAAAANRAYWKSHPPWGDSATYTYFFMEAAERAERAGRIDAILHELENNRRYPLRTVPVLAFAPSLLRSPNGHLYTSGVMLFCFLATAMWTLRLRTGSLLCAGFGALMFVVPSGFFNPKVGHPINLLDLPAAYLVGAALCALLNSDGARRPGWLVLFGVFAAGAALARYVASMYALILAGPVLAAYLVARWRAERKLWNAVVRPLLAVGVPIGILALPFLITWYRENAEFYRRFGYAIGGATLGESFGYLMSFLNGFYGRAYAVALAASAALLLIANRGRGGRWTDLLEPAWFASAHLAFAVVVARVADDAAVYYYATPGLFLLAVTPLIAREAVPPRRLYAALLIGAVILSAWQFWGRANELENPRPADLEAKRFVNELARDLARDGRRVVWSPFFAEYAVAPSVEAGSHFGVLPLSAGQDFFTNHLSHWKAQNPGMTLEQIQERVYARTCRWVHIAVVRRDPEHRSFEFDNDWAESIAQFVSRRIQEDPRWVKDFEIDGPYGPLVGYRNLNPDPDLYERRLFLSPTYGLMP